MSTTECSICKQALAEKNKLIDTCLDEIKRIKGLINDAKMHLATNIDIDGNSMKDSDAFDVLNKA